VVTDSSNSGDRDEDASPNLFGGADSMVRQRVVGAAKPCGSSCHGVAINPEQRWGNRASRPSDTDGYSTGP